MFHAISRTICNQRSISWLQLSQQYHRRSLSTANKQNYGNEDGRNKQTEEKGLTIDPKSKLIKAFPNYFHDGTIHNRAKYTEFVYDAIKRLEELGLEKDLRVYKELLKVFPTNLYHPKSMFSKVTMFHGQQQVCVLKLLFEMEKHQVWPDKEMEKLIVERFSRYSDVWLKIVRMNYWSMKFRNTNPFPIPENPPDNPVELTKLALARMCVDKKTILSVWNTSRIPTSTDKTWIISAQSHVQQEMIDKLNNKDILYIEEGGRAYIRNKSIIYYVLKKYHDKPKIKPEYEEPEQDYNNMAMQFYGKPIKEKQEDVSNMHDVDDGYILAIGVTGTCSHDSLLSWLKLMQERNPKLKDMSVVFRINRPIKDLVDISNDMTNLNEESENLNVKL